MALFFRFIVYSSAVQCLGIKGWVVVSRNKSNSKDGVCCCLSSLNLRVMYTYVDRVVPILTDFSDSGRNSNLKNPHKRPKNLA